jgi:hypothetical protein
MFCEDAVDLSVGWRCSMVVALGRVDDEWWSCIELDRRARAEEGVDTKTLSAGKGSVDWRAR